MLLGDEKEAMAETGERLSFTWIAKQIILRQKHEKDTIMIVVGERRNGKSNWVLKLIREYITQKRLADPKFKWSWDDNFPLTRGQAVDKVDKIPDESFVVYDEGGDIMYRGDTLSIMNKRLIKFMLKTGKKKLLTIIALPDVRVLDPKILNMAILLIAVPYRYKDYCAFAFIYARNPNPFNKDKFGLEHIQRLFQSRKSPKHIFNPSMEGVLKAKYKGKMINIPYPKNLFATLKSLPTFIHYHRFGRVKKWFETSYIKNVKNRQLMIHTQEEDYIKKIHYIKIKRIHETVLLNLHTRAEMNFSRIADLHIDGRGNRMMGVETIKKIINTAGIKEEYGRKRSNGELQRE